MRIAVSGTTQVGKSSYIEDFLDIWPNFTTPKKTYRDVVDKGKNLKSGETTEEIQKDILNFMCKEHKKYRSSDTVIFDRCPLDNIVYTLWCNGKERTSDKFVEESMKRARKALSKLDIIFFLPLTRAAPVEFKGSTEEAVERTEIDNIYKQIHHQWMTNPNCSVFEPRDKPAIIEMFGTRHERIALTRMYLNDKGQPIDATPTLEQLSEVKDMESLVNQLRESD